MKVLFAGMSLAYAISSSAAYAKYKDFNIALPIIAMGGEAQAKFEYNLSGNGGLGIEVLMLQESEVYTDEEMEENSYDSILKKGQELAISYSSYSNGGSMSGGYWGLGIGYRQVQADWLRSPSEEFSPAGASLDSNGKFKHELMATGMTAHAKVGYRYVADSFPLSVGAYIGMRHFNNRFKDRETESGTVETPEIDQDSLSRRFTTALQPGIEIGMAF